jgi:hypothetical protein
MKPIRQEPPKPARVVDFGLPWAVWRDASWQDVQFLGKLTSAFRTAAYSTEPTHAPGAKEVP